MMGSLIGIIAGMFISGVMGTVEYFSTSEEIKGITYVATTVVAGICIIILIKMFGSYEADGVEDDSINSIERDINIIQDDISKIREIIERSNA